MPIARVLALAFVTLSTLAHGQTPAPADGEAQYQQHCATCHERGVTRAAPRSTLKQLPAETIRFALTKGSMSSQAASLTDEQREAVIRFLASPTATAATPAA